MNKYIPIEKRYGDKLHFFIDRARKEIEKNLEKYSVQENLTEKQIETAYELYQEAIITVVAEIVINKREHTRACKENLEYKKFIEYVFKNDEELEEYQRLYKKLERNQKWASQGINPFWRLMALAFCWLIWIPYLIKYIVKITIEKKETNEYLEKYGYVFYAYNQVRRTGANCVETLANAMKKSIDGGL